VKERERVPCVIKDVRATNSKNVLSVHTLPLRSTTNLRDAATLSRIEDARGAAVRAATVRTVVTRIAHLALRADAEALPARCPPRPRPLRLLRKLPYPRLPKRPPVAAPLKLLARLPRAAHVIARGFALLEDSACRS